MASSYGQITIVKRSSRSTTGTTATTKQFLRKTAKGKVQKVLREHYLRTDIPCGSAACTKCPPLYAAQQPPKPRQDQDGDEGMVAVKRRKVELLSAKGRKGHKTFKIPHYLVVDTNVVLHQIDVLESSHFGEGLIFPSTVLDEVRARSFPLHKRLVALLAETDASGQSARGWVFANEASSATYVEAARTVAGGPPELVNDRNDQAIRTTAAWYAEHLKDAGLAAVLLTDDAANRRLAKESGLMAAGTREYIEGMPDDVALALGDLVAAAGTVLPEVEMADAGVKTAIFEEHLALGSLHAGIKSGLLHQGIFRPSTYNHLEGSVQTSAFPKPILLVGKEAMNRAVDGDVVAVQVLPESQWKAPTDEVLDEEAPAGGAEDSDEEDADADAADDVKEVALAAQKASRKPSDRQPTGKVVGVTKRNWRPLVCHLDASSIPSSAIQGSSALCSVFALPVARGMPRIRLRTRQAPRLLGQKILVAMDRWDVNSRAPEGHFIRALGQAESKEAEQESLLLEHDIPYRPFSRAVLEGLPEEGERWVVPEKRESSKIWMGREDLRERVICSIDPPGCQDIDDALHARVLPNGRIEAGVHIADVSHFVLPETAMDAEAASRGTTVYLVDKRIDMLPSLLGTNLCSLRPFVERLAFSVIWELDPSDASIVSVRFTKSVIASKAAFTYEEAQRRKDDPTLSDDITVGVRLLNDLAIKLRKARMEAGALDLASPEVKIHMESSETSGPVDVEQKQQMETNKLVEEFMLLANISVAKRIFESFPQTAVLRRHNPPPQTNFEVLQEVLLKRKGFSLDVSSSGALAKSLDLCVDPNMPSFNTLVRIMATRCMLSAEYFCSGSVSRDAFGHYGLASPIYTHFTSPIRRYADVLVHRQLLAAVTSTPLHATLHSKPFVEKVMDNINRRHTAAQRAGRASVEFYVALAIRAREEAQGGKPVRAAAFVTRAFRNGLAVFVSQFGLEGIVKFQRDTVYDTETFEVSIPADAAKPDGEVVKVGVFDEVGVEISVEQDRNTRRGRVKMVLVEPVSSEGL